MGKAAELLKKLFGESWSQLFGELDIERKLKEKQKDEIIGATAWILDLAKAENLLIAELLTDQFNLDDLTDDLMEKMVEEKVGEKKGRQKKRRPQKERFRPETSREQRPDSGVSRAGDLPSRGDVQSAKIKRRQAVDAQAWAKRSLALLAQRYQQELGPLVAAAERGLIEPEVALQPLNKMIAQIGTIGRTALEAAQRKIHLEAAQRLGTNLFWYAGPGPDAVIRPYCGALVDKVVDGSRLPPNGMGLPPLVYAGGWNCRHTLVPVTPRIIKARRLKVATEKDYELARAGGVEVAQQMKRRRRR